MLRCKHKSYNNCHTTTMQPIIRHCPDIESFVQSRLVAIPHSNGALSNQYVKLLLLLQHKTYMFFIKKFKQVYLLHTATYRISTYIFACVRNGSFVKLNHCNGLCIYINSSMVSRGYAKLSLSVGWGPQTTLFT